MRNRVQLMRGHHGLVLLLVALLGAACSSASSASSSAATLVAIGNGTAKTAIPHVRRGDPLVVASYPLCTRGGPVIITRVAPLDPRGGIRLAGWGVRKEFPGDDYTQNDNGENYGPVTQYRGFGHHRIVGALCGKQAESTFYDMDVSVATSAAAGSMRGFLITYVARGSIRRTSTVFGIALCTGETCPHHAG